MRDAMDDGKEREMMETESGSPDAAPPSRELVRTALEYLHLARRLINEEKPSHALQAIVMAVRTYGGEQAVSQLMIHSRELYSSKVQQTVAVDQLTSLFGGCAIGEAQGPQPQIPVVTEAGPSIGDAQENSILAETGRNQVIQDAFDDGSSFICSQCGGLVSMNRRDEHYAYWCSKM